MTKSSWLYGLSALLLLSVVVSGEHALADGPQQTTAQEGNPRLTPVVRAIQRAKTSVVNIHSEKTAYGDESLFGSGGRGRKVNGMGTGIVVDERGYIVTNYHVVHGVDSLTATLDDGSTYEARVVSYDRKHDLAIVRIRPGKPLKVMPLGTSADTMLGETVIAIGNAFGYEHTVTRGIVSALGRDVEVNEKQSYENLIQTDASINPGNSGGPLVNLEGDVVGINVAIRAGAQRIGFAIPIDDARKIIARLLSVERLNDAWHGIRGRDVKSAEGMQLVVAETVPDSPAEKAGLQTGDVVLRVGPVKVNDAADLERALLDRASEDLELVVRRDDARQTLGLRVAGLSRRGPVVDREITVVRANNDPAEESADDPAWRQLGLDLVPLGDDTRVLRGSKYRGGMRVARVRAGSPASRNGIRKNDVLVGLHVWETINRENVVYVLDHPQFDSFNPLKFYIVRGRETLYGHLRVTAR